MSHPSKAKGNGYERQLVKKLEALGFEAERAWGSNGVAMGEAAEVDVRFNRPGGKKWRVQAKRRKKIASYLHIEAGVDMVVIREDRGEDLAVVPLALILSLLE